MTLQAQLHRTAERIVRAAIEKTKKAHPDKGTTWVREKAAGQLGITRQTTFKYCPAEK